MIFWSEFLYLGKILVELDVNLILMLNELIIFVLFNVKFVVFGFGVILGFLVL